MRLKLIACKVFSRELSYLCSMSDNIVDITWIRQGYHNTPEELQQFLQKEIDAIEAGDDIYTNRMNSQGMEGGIAADFDAILLGYGLCSNAVTGVKAKKHRIVIPKAHDCVTMFLGSKEKYAEFFEKLPGCYWFTAGWIENSDMPGEDRDRRLSEYFVEEGYDEDTIEYLLEELGGLRNYHNIAYVPMPFRDKEADREMAKKAAEYYGWDYHEVSGSMSLMEKFIAGDWDESEFLVLEPGESAAQSYDQNVIKAVL